MKVSGAGKFAGIAWRAAVGAGRLAVRGLRQPAAPAPAPAAQRPPPPTPPPEQPGRLHIAAAPSLLSQRGWWEVGLKLYDQLFRDRLMLVAAGVAFYAMMSIFPALTVLIWFYGWFSDPSEIVAQLKTIVFLLPVGSLDVVEQQARAIAATGRSSLNMLILSSILIAMWSSNAAVKAMVEAMNIIYQEDEKRSFVELNIRTMFFTLAALAMFLASLAALVLAPILLSYVNLQSRFAIVVLVLRWPILYAITVVFLIVLNRYGPSRPPERARWAIWGSALGAGLWLAVSIGFSWYVEHLGNLAATYGSIAAIAGLMLWLWLSALVILIGMALNHELEKRTESWELHQKHLVAMEEWERTHKPTAAEPAEFVRKSFWQRLLGD